MSRESAVAARWRYDFRASSEPPLPTADFSLRSALRARPCAARDGYCTAPFGCGRNDGLTARPASDADGLMARLEAPPRSPSTGAGFVNGASPHGEAVPRHTPTPVEGLRGRSLQPGLQATGTPRRPCASRRHPTPIMPPGSAPHAQEAITFAIAINRHQPPATLIYLWVRSGAAVRAPPPLRRGPRMLESPPPLGAGPSLHHILWRRPRIMRVDR